MSADSKNSNNSWQCPIEIAESSDPTFLPRVLVSHRTSEAPESSTARTKPMLYPPANNRDEEGYLALKEGSLYYEEAMSFAAAKQMAEAIDCFRAAELMYLHAASRSNIQAYANLGYLYHYNRCNGSYFVSADENKAESPSEALIVVLLKMDSDMRAYYCFLHAARRGHAESCCMVGDLMASGKGCKKNETDAFKFYMRAYELSLKYDSAIWGNAAVRVASCYERGIGCQRNLNESYTWYARAIKGLDSSARTNNKDRSKMLSEAKNGMKRIEQHLQ